MFDNLSSSFSKIFSTLSRAKIVTESHIDDAISQIKLSLLDADVDLKVVKSFTEGLKPKLLGQDVVKGVKPVEMIIKITQDELAAILGSDFETIYKPHGAKKVIMMVGLQGSGKTTSTAKLALHLKSKYQINPIVTSLDFRRPAAQEQLKILAQNNNISIFEDSTAQDVITKTRHCLDASKNHELLLLDTAGRTQIDDELMQELVEIKKIAKPDEILLVVDALIGRQSLDVAQKFHDLLGLTGVILTRVDGDGRNGVALNIRHTLGVQIKYFGTGEKISNFEEFHPDRIASRILDMGDVVSLVEKAQELIDEKETTDMMAKMQKGQFDMNDLLKQLQALKKFGGIGKILGFLPGAAHLKEAMNANGMGKDFITKQEVIILSMTKTERSNPQIILKSSSRLKRVADGSGTKIADVNRVLNRFFEMKTIMDKVAKTNPKLAADPNAKLSQGDLMSLLQGGGAKKKSDLNPNKKRYKF